MKLNLKNIWVPLLTLAIGYTSLVLGMCGITETCTHYQMFGKYSLTIFEPALAYSIAIAPLAIALVFTNSTETRKILRFSLWWLPASALLIMMAKTNSNSWMPLYPEPTKENLAWFMGGLFTIFSFRLITHAYRSRKA